MNNKLRVIAGDNENQQDNNDEDEDLKLLLPQLTQSDTSYNQQQTIRQPTIDNKHIESQNQPNNSEPINQVKSFDDESNEINPEISNRISTTINSIIQPNQYLRLYKNREMNQIQSCIIVNYPKGQNGKTWVLLKGSILSEVQENDLTGYDEALVDQPLDLWEPNKDEMTVKDERRLYKAGDGNYRAVFVRKWLLNTRQAIIEFEGGNGTQCKVSITSLEPWKASLVNRQWHYPELSDTNTVLSRYNSSQIAYQAKIQSRRDHIEQSGGICKMMSTLGSTSPNTNDSLLPGSSPMPTIEQRDRKQSFNPTLIIPNYSKMKQKGNGKFSEKLHQVLGRKRRKRRKPNGDDPEDSSDDDDDDGNSNSDGDDQDGNLAKMLIRNQRSLVKLLGKKSKSSTNWSKLPKCDVKYYGVKKNGETDDLIRKAWDVTQWMKLRKLSTEATLQIWLTDVLQEPARSLIYKQQRTIQTFEQLIEILQAHYPVKPKLKEKIRNFYEFKYKKRTSMTAHIMVYTSLINDINEEAWIWNNITMPNRLPDLPSHQRQYEVLLKSIKSLDRLYWEVVRLQYTITPNINSVDYEITNVDINNLSNNMIAAENMLYPRSELSRLDMTSKFPSRFQRNSYKSKERKPIKRRFPSNRYKSTKDRRTNRYAPKQKIRMRKPFKGKCHACGGSHMLRYCKNKMKKTNYCKANRLCLFCAKANHTIAQCTERQKWRKEKDAGNGDQTKSKPYQKQTKPQNQSKPNRFIKQRQSIKFMTACQNEPNCEYGDDCHYLHESDYKLEPLTEDKTVRKEKIHALSRKERINVKTSLERINIKYYKLNWDEIPTKDRIMINLRQKDSDTMVRFPALLDSGSTISAITPRVADKFRQALEYERLKGSKFLCENGGKEDELFSGEYYIIPTLIPNTTNFEEIKFYIMPHNECSHGIILGDSDRKRLNYKFGLEVEPGKILYSHNGKGRKKKLKIVERSNKILERLDNMPGHAWQDRNLQVYEKAEEIVNDELESELSEEESESCDSSEESDDDDGIH